MYEMATKKENRIRNNQNKFELNLKIYISIVFDTFIAQC